MRAIEVEGTVDEQGRLVLRDPIRLSCSSRVRVIVLIPENGDMPDEAAWLKSAVSNPSFEFLNDPEEDIYSPEDGEPFHATP